MNDYSFQYIKKLYHNSYTHRMLHFETIGLQHAIKSYPNNWKEYNPTHFMYVFFCFNTLYSINWNLSLSRGVIKNHDDVGERYKYESMIKFCFENDNFCREFKPKFMQIIANELTREKIEDIIDTIKPDTYNLGNIDAWKIGKFRTAVQSLYDGGFSECIVKEIVTFIYKIRNNIFHGTKTLTDMLMPEHQLKLLLYSYFIIAINQMLFSYIDFLYEESTGVELDDYYTFEKLMMTLENRKKNSESHYSLEEDYKMQGDL